MTRGGLSQWSICLSGLGKLSVSRDTSAETGLPVSRPLFTLFSGDKPLNTLVLSAGPEEKATESFQHSCRPWFLLIWRFSPNVTSVGQFSIKTVDAILKKQASSVNIYSVRNLKGLRQSYGDKSQDKHAFLSLVRSLISHYVDYIISRGWRGTVSAVVRWEAATRLGQVGSQHLNSSRAKGNCEWCSRTALALQQVWGQQTQ